MPLPSLISGICFTLVAVLVVLVVLATFPYGYKPFPTQPLSNVSFGLHILQIDDYGTFWDPTGAETVLDEITSKTKGGNTVVLLYIHGWHHNARPGDSNLKGFKKTLKKLTSLLDCPPYAESRKILTDQKAISVIGIYIGWRGRSLPGLLDYLTVWPRKAAAERVGSGDLREFLARLDKLYVKRNQRASGPSPFMGLVTTGHSLGGQALFKSVSETLERQLIDATSRLSGDSGSQSSEPASLSKPLRGIGDITVLLNPALEAYQFDRLHRLSTQLTYDFCQTPTLVVVSGEDDSARQLWFPIARSLNHLFRPPFRDTTQRALWRTALGEYEPQRTHTLELSTAANTLTPDNYLTPSQVLGTDFTGRTVLGGAELKPLDSRATPFRPIVVAYSSSKLIQGHIGIFTETFRDFLTDYVAFIEGKRMFMRSSKADGFVCPEN